jgi:hypothetical protein
MLGVDAIVKVSVVDRCNCCLQTGDEDLIGSTIRCL